MCTYNEGTNHEILCFEKWSGSCAGLGSARFQKELGAKKLNGELS